MKTIGDAMMIRFESAADAVALGVRTTHELGARHAFPSIRVGMHTGPATARGNDWFGSAVNVAARVSGVAAGGEALLTEDTKAAAGKVGGIDFQARGQHDLKNVATPVKLYSAVPVGAERGENLPIDPVCRMAIEPARAAGQMTYRGVEYTFCSLECAQAFSADPERHIGASARPSRAAGIRNAAAAVQGASYAGFGIWSIAARGHYRRAHGIRRDDWVLNAHGAWLVTVGLTLGAAAARRQADQAEVRLLGGLAALGLAVNDLFSRRAVPAIYRADLAFELALLAAWFLPENARRRGTG